jgi:ketol-acid reductoisomerase
MAYFEVLNELKLIVDLMYEGGLGGMWDSVSDTAEYGGLTRGDAVVDEQVRENMEAVLEQVQNGEFATEWVAENQANRPKYAQLRQAEQHHDIEEVGARLRDLFAWKAQDEQETEDDEQSRVRVNE